MYCCRYYIEILTLYLASVHVAVQACLFLPDLKHLSQLFSRQVSLINVSILFFETSAQSFLNYSLFVNQIIVVNVGRNEKK